MMEYVCRCSSMVSKWFFLQFSNYIVQFTFFERYANPPEKHLVLYRNSKLK